MAEEVKKLEKIAIELTEVHSKFHIDTDNVPTIVAVSKTHSESNILPLLDVGHRVFGENRVQEAQKKWPQLKEQYEDIELHLIGPLQTNKVKEAVSLFDVIETVDRPKLASVIAKEIERTGKKPICLIQVNTGEEEQKAGIAPKDADDFIVYCSNDLDLPIQGLMCIPPASDEPSLHFALLRTIAERNMHLFVNSLPWLSMGMSADYITAVAMGATHIRVGSAIFGERN